MEFLQEPGNILEKLIEFGRAGRRDIAVKCLIAKPAGPIESTQKRPPLCPNYQRGAVDRRAVVTRLARDPVAGEVENSGARPIPGLVGNGHCAIAVNIGEQVGGQIEILA